MLAEFAHVEHQGCLAPKAPDIASLRETTHELSVIVDEVANIFAEDWVLRYGIEDLEIEPVGGNIDFLEE